MRSATLTRQTQRACVRVARGAPEWSALDDHLVEALASLVPEGFAWLGGRCAVIPADIVPKLREVMGADAAWLRVSPLRHRPSTKEDS